MSSSGSDDDRFLDPLAETMELVAAGRGEEAVLRCERLSAAGRAGTLTRIAHGRVLLALGRVQEAVNVLREAGHLSPNTPELLLSYGEALAAAGALPAAIGEFQRAARLAPQDERAHLAMARLWLEAGEADKALEALDAACALGDVPDDTADDIRQRAAGIATGTRADAGYVKHLFNQFAADYDTRMQGRLGYAAPSILRQLAGMLTSPGERFDLLDLGCGTGLSGVAFQDLARSLSGVDLSPRMLEKARATDVYTRLAEGDVERLPPGFEGPFGIVLAADVLVYLGDLEALFATVRSRIAPDGLWLFTTERGEAVDFELGPKRRYRHSEAYLRGLAERHGFDVSSLVECVCRFEAGTPVTSWAGAFRVA
jgi:predicted TPR repeat methyltransferase